MQNLQSIKNQLFEKYLENVQDIQEKFDRLKEADISTVNFRSMVSAK